MTRRSLQWQHGQKAPKERETLNTDLPFLDFKKRHFCRRVDDWRAVLVSSVDATPGDRTSDNSSIVKEDGNSVPVQQAS